MRHWSPHRASLTRRRFLGATAGTLGLALSVPAVDAASHPDGGLVWTRRDEVIENRYWTDIVAGGEAAFVVCGTEERPNEEAAGKTVVRTTDRWGHLQSQRKGPEWGDGSSELLAHDEGYLLAGRDDGAPLLIGFPDAAAQEFLVPAWRRTYDGSPAGPVSVATTDAGHAIGWTETATDTGATVAGTEATGTTRWTADLDTGRRLLDVLPAPSADGSVLAVGTHGGDGSSSEGWLTTWQEDGTRSRDRSISTPGEPGGTTVDGSAVVLAGTDADGAWLQRRRADWSVAWTRSYRIESDSLELDDIVAGAGGYGVLVHDGSGVIVIKTVTTGTEQWRGRYRPYSEGDGDGVRGRALLPVDDEFGCETSGCLTGRRTRSDGCLASNRERWLAAPNSTPV